MTQLLSQEKLNTILVLYEDLLNEEFNGYPENVKKPLIFFIMSRILNVWKTYLTVILTDDLIDLNLETCFLEMNIYPRMFDNDIFKGICNRFLSEKENVFSRNIRNVIY